MLRNLRNYALMALAVAVSVELLAFAGGKLLVGRGLVYAPGDLRAWDEYLAKRDPLLGWPSPTSFGTGEYDRSGSRLVPLYPDPDAHPACVSLFGDSFTWGDEVGPGDAWSNVLSGLLHCRVANYGVPGYGTDQAYLRYKHRIRDAAKVVVLGHWSEDIIRNVNRFRGFIAPAAMALKPRFLVDDAGRLTLVPAPELSREQIADIDRSPELLPHEYFLPGGPTGVTALRPPYSLGLLRLVHHYRLRARIEGVPSYAAFYAADHPSHALRVTLEILKAFDREAHERKQHPIVLLIPAEADLRQLRKSGSLAYDPLAEELRRIGIETPEVARRMLDRLGARRPCALFTRCPNGHLNAEGHILLAQIVREWIRDRGVALP